MGPIHGDHRDSAAAGVAEAERALGGARVLLVEDNEIGQIVASEALRARGVAVTVAASGREALAALRRERFDAVLMDVEMPEMDGCEAAAAIRADEALRGLPVVGLTAHAAPEDRARCLAAGMDDHVTKPFTAADLLPRLARVVAAYRRGGG
jgi:CheY-like chemotaxis protein